MKQKNVAMATKNIFGCDAFIIVELIRALGNIPLQACDPVGRGALRCPRRAQPRANPLDLTARNIHFLSSHVHILSPDQNGTAPRHSLSVLREFNFRYRWGRAAPHLWTWHALSWLLDMERGSRMRATSVVRYWRLFEKNGLSVCIDGGWAVDAVLGRQTPLAWRSRYRFAGERGTDVEESAFEPRVQRNPTARFVAT